MTETVPIIIEVTDFLNQGVTCVNWFLDSATSIVRTFLTSSGMDVISSVVTNPVTPPVIGVMFTTLIAWKVFDFVRGR